VLPSLLLKGVLSMTDSRPIGLFDSGLGGLSMWRAVISRLPEETTRYVADRAYCPYGPRPAEEIINRARMITRFLIHLDCKLIIVACNTASAAALHILRTEFDLPFVGMEPAIKPAAQATRTGHIGLLATTGTLQGRLFQNTVQRHANGTQIHIQIGEGLVEQVENGQLDTPATARLLHHYLDPMLAAGVDQIVLGCTHYPLLIPLIEQIVAGRAEVIDPAQAVARQVERVLASTGQLHAPASQVEDEFEVRHRFYTSGHPHTFRFQNGRSSPDHNIQQFITFQAIDLKANSAFHCFEI
jgi:glutamate racemase